MNRGWKHKVELQGLLAKDPSEVAKTLASSLRRLPAGFRDQGSFDTLDDFIQWLDHADGEDEVNETLREIYDWADTHRLWLYITH